MNTEIQRIPTPLYAYDRSLFTARTGSWKVHPELPPSFPSRAPDDRKRLSTSSFRHINHNAVIFLRVLTWNIWFDQRFKSERTLEFTRVVKQVNPDVCCLQEVTPGFENTLRSDAYWRDTWMMTSLVDQMNYTMSHYGTMILVKKSLVKKQGFGARAYFVPFPGTQTGRCLTVLELYPKAPGTLPILIGTVHLDYTPQLRASHIDIAIQALSTSSTDTPIGASIFCGDTNFISYAETEPLLRAGFIDGWLSAHPAPTYDSDPNFLISTGTVTGSTVDLLLGDPTYGEIGIRKRGEGPREGEEVRRLDLLMCRGWRVKGCQVTGDMPIPLRKLKRSGVMEGDDLVVWSSDHKGVYIDVEVA